MEGGWGLTTYYLVAAREIYTEDAAVNSFEIHEAYDTRKLATPGSRHGLYLSWGLQPIMRGILVYLTGFLPRSGESVWG